MDAVVAVEMRDSSYGLNNGLDLFPPFGFN
jgi:hypothetical protein